ncbi:MAG: hypothetical protein LBB74_07965 [Chitinispirillales bacterium]|jgi:hypothetical protein|nr:hypothetical protein [Chitinispirillales bacterium]
MKRAIMIAAAVIAVAALPHGIAFGQAGQGGMLPPWVNDTWRESQYPPGEWYVGYSVDAVTGGAKLSDVQRRAERAAQLKLAEGVSVNIKSVSVTGTESKRTTDGKNASETVKKDYKQQILASTDAEVAKVELTTFHDQANNRVHALAKVRKADLAAYYVSRIDYYQQNAENDLKLAKQFADSDKKRSAVEKIADAMKNINECGKYTELLSAVDYKDTKRLVDKGAALLREIAAFETKVQESASIFVGGREILNEKDVSIVIPSIQSMLSESGCRVADRREESNFILTVDVRDCEKSASGSFFYVYACVKADVYNVKTGRSDAKMNFTAPKAGWTNEEKAGKKAFEEAASALWKEVREKTEICK